MKKLLLNYLIYFSFLFLICLVGISNVFADTYTNIGYLSDKSSVQVAVSYQTPGNAPLTVNKDQLYNIPDIWSLMIDISNYSFSANVIYELEFNMPLSHFNNNVNSIEVTGATNSGCHYISSRNMDGSYPRVRFSCNNASNGLFINFSNSSQNTIITYNSHTTGGSDFRWNYTYLILVNVSQDTTIIEQNNQIIQQNQTIIQNQENNTQDIINNQNQNTQQQIESQKVCNTRTYHYSDLPSSNAGFYTDFNSFNSSTSFRYSDLIPVSPGEIIVYSTQQVSSAKNCFFDKSKVGISCYLSNTSTTTISENFKYVRFNINSSPNSYVTIYSCKNGNQALDDSINNLDNTINNSDVDSSDGIITDLQNNLPTNNVISSLLLLPVRLLQALVNSLGGTCSTFSLGSLMGTNLVMPCINLQNYLGSTIWTFIDLVFSGMFILVIRKKFIQIFENITNLKGGGNEVD